MTSEVGGRSETPSHNNQPYSEAAAIFSDPVVMKEWTESNRTAEGGAVVSREEAIARLRAAGKRVR